MSYVPDLLNLFGFLLSLLLFSFLWLSFDALIPLVRTNIKASNSRRRVNTDSENWFDEVQSNATLAQSLSVL